MPWPDHEFCRRNHCLASPKRRVVLLTLAIVSLVGCGNVARSRAYASARAALDAEISALPTPVGSQILARRDGVSTGQVEACACVNTELLLGNVAPAAQVYRFYQEEMGALGWQVRLEGHDGVVLERGRAAIEVSDLYYTSAVTGHDRIEDYEAEFESLVLVGVAYAVYDPDVCEQAVGDSD